MELDRTQRKASEISLRSPLDIYFQEFSRQCPETPNMNSFMKPKWCQKEENQQTMTIIESVLKVVRTHQHAKFQGNSSMCSPGNARNPQILHVTRSQNSTKIRTINRPWLWSIQFWRWSGYISMHNFRPIPPCVLREMPGTPKFDPFH